MTTKHEKKRAKKELRALIDFFDKYGFCKKVYARNEIGKEVSPDDPEAMEFCFFGARLRLKQVRSLGPNLVVNAMKEACGGPVVFWNDQRSTTKEKMIQKLTEAIKIVDAL
jgi:hypothetical protein